MYIDHILIIFILLCIYSDIRYRKVYNLFTVPAALLGLGLNILMSGTEGIMTSVTGCVVGFLFLYTFYKLGGVGAGDVKFMAAVGSLKGPSFVLMGGMYGAVVAGVVAVVVMLAQDRSFTRLKEVGTALFCFSLSKNTASLKFDKERSIHLPYAAFLAVGILIYFISTL